MVYFYAIIGMICWGISPLFAKSGLKGIDPIVGLSIRSFFTAAAIMLWMFLSGGITELRGIPGKTLLLLVAEAILATIIGDLAYFAALKFGSPSVVMIIMACSPVVTILCSVFFMHEHLTYKTLLGAGLTIIGLILVI